MVRLSATAALVIYSQDDKGSEVLRWVIVKWWIYHAISSHHVLSALITQV
jgi:hypothetical protein